MVKRLIPALAAGAILAVMSSPFAFGTPANRAALESRYGHFLAGELNQCMTCHLPSNVESPQTLEEFPHNPFGVRLRELGKRLDMEERLAAVAEEDADGDGVANELELLLAGRPGEAETVPGEEKMGVAGERLAAFKEFLEGYRWRPFEPVPEVAVPEMGEGEWSRNPIDRFIAQKHAEHGLKPAPEAPREVLLRRVSLDLIGLAPTPEEQREFLADRSPVAYERLVDRLLNDPLYGERWGRHWMDVWRYSDWAGWSGGNQIRDSQPHIWAWRDWIVESLNADKGYDRMILEMLAADEVLPADTEALRATGFLVRNYKRLSREQWLEDTIKHTSQAFLGLTMGCAKCHDHMYDPVSQEDYYRLRAIFEPHQVRTDRVPGELDTGKAGLVRAYDAELDVPTYFFVRGDERSPDTNRVMEPGVPGALEKFGEFKVEQVALPMAAAWPDKREFVRRDLVAAREREVAAAQKEMEQRREQAASPAAGEEQRAQLKLEVARAALIELKQVVAVERLEDRGEQESGRWRRAAQAAWAAQSALERAEAELDLHEAREEVRQAKEKVEEHAASGQGADLAKEASSSGVEQSEAEKETAKELAEARENHKEAQAKCEKAEERLREAELKLAGAASTDYKRRKLESYPEQSTGRRLAFARWLMSPENPLTARVAVNHIWLRHFGRGLVPTPQDFGRNGLEPSHPQLLDWLARRFMEQGWQMKELHRLLVTSRAYRAHSTSDAGNLEMDPDNIYLWRMNSRRMEAELVRDNLLHVSGGLSRRMGGPEIDHGMGMKSPRRSLYLRIAAQKEDEFLKIFDGPAVTECYQRHSSVVPQQALALANSELTVQRARALAKWLGESSGGDHPLFVRQAFRRILSRAVEEPEERLCLEFLERAAREGKGKNGEESTADARERLVMVLLNHNDFVTIR